MNLRFGFDVGRKFCADGSVRFWPGNTMVCILDHQTEVFSRVKEIRNDLMRNPIGSCLSPLPDESLHMTAIEGIVDGNRAPEHWTTLLPTDTPLKEVDDFFEKKWKTIPPMGEVHMTFDHIRTGSAVVLALRPTTEEDNRRIRLWREIVSTTMGLRFAGFETYEFHISMAYGYRWPTEEEMQNLEELVKQYDRSFREEPFSFRVPEPSMTYFDNMFYFNKERIPRR